MTDPITKFRTFLKQPALSLGEFFIFCGVVFGFWGTALVFLSVRPACADPTTADEQMLRDFGLVPETRAEAEPIRVSWEGAPVPVALDVGAERRLVFPESFRLGLEPGVSNHFEHEIYDRLQLIRPLRPLATRAKVQLLATGRILFLDFRATTGTGFSTSPLEVVIPADEPEATAEAEEIPEGVLGVGASPPGYVDLVRFAAQRLYAPERLLTDRPGLREASTDSRPMHLVRGAPVVATPIAGWEEAGLFVTAVRIRNEWDRPVPLGGRGVVGKWRAAAVHHHLLPAGSDTALYLVSDVPFREALGFWKDIREAGPETSTSIHESHQEKLR
ncbi:MAG: DUF3438 family protein [Gammaproteobacteria bacterium]|nr:DUF3438 family protein [Gammaproteobacteria bacterium]